MDAKNERLLSHRKLSVKVLTDQKAYYIDNIARFSRLTYEMKTDISDKEFEDINKLIESNKLVLNSLTLLTDKLAHLKRKIEQLIEYKIEDDTNIENERTQTPTIDTRGTDSKTLKMLPPKVETSHPKPSGVLESKSEPDPVFWTRFAKRDQTDLAYNPDSMQPSKNPMAPYL